MSNNIPGRGKHRNHGQDLNSNAMPMGGGQMAMPPNGASAPFATPIISQLHALATQDYGRPMYGGVEVQHLQQPPVSGSHHPTMVVPNGMNVQQEQTSQYANIQGLPPQNMRGGGNPNMQWQGLRWNMRGGINPNNMLWQKTKSDQPAPAPTPAPPAKENKSLFSADQIKQWGLEKRVAPISAPPAPAPAAVIVSTPQRKTRGTEMKKGPTCNGTSTTTVKDDRRGTLLPQRSDPMGGVPTRQQQPMHGGSTSSGVQSMNGGVAFVSVPAGMAPEGIFHLGAIDDRRYQMDKDRKHQVDLAIVRIMKAREIFHHNLLVVKVMVELQDRFDLNNQLIEMRIESLIESKYIKRSEDDQRLYLYIP